MSSEAGKTGSPETSIEPIFNLENLSSCLPDPVLIVSTAVGRRITRSVKHFVSASLTATR